MQLEDYQSEKSVNVKELEKRIAVLETENLHLRHVVEDQNEIITSMRANFTEKYNQLVEDYNNKGRNI